jgi:hypothetical protein
LSRLWKPVKLRPGSGRREQALEGRKAMAEIGVRVDCYSGYRGEQEPRSFHFGSRPIAVDEILDRWLGPDYRYFKLLGADGATYILRHDVVSHEWSLAFYRRGMASEDAGSPQSGISAMKAEASA